MDVRTTLDELQRLLEAMAARKSRLDEAWLKIFSLA